jgi:hypothetical protein
MLITGMEKKSFMRPWLRLARALAGGCGILNRRPAILHQYRCDGSC